MNVEANPSSVDSGGSSIITVTLTFDSTGSPAAGETVNAVSGSGGALDAATATTDSNGQAFFSVLVTTPATVTVSVEDIQTNIRINVNA